VCAAGYNTYNSGECTENTCTAKADAAAWEALGCVVATSATANTVTGLGAQSAAAGYQSCAITCPTDGAAFTVTAVENACTAKADAAAWAAVGCVVAGTQDATTVTGLGAQSAATGYQSCAITCPTDGAAFSVTAVETLSTLSGAGVAQSSVALLLASVLFAVAKTA